MGRILLATRTGGVKRLLKMPAGRLLPSSPGWTCRLGLAGVTDTVHGAEHNFGFNSEICATIWQRAQRHCLQGQGQFPEPESSHLLQQHFPGFSRHGHQEPPLQMPSCTRWFLRPQGYSSKGTVSSLRSRHLDAETNRCCHLISQVLWSLASATGSPVYYRFPSGPTSSRRFAPARPWRVRLPPLISFLPAD